MGGSAATVVAFCALSSLCHHRPRFDPSAGCSRERRAAFRAPRFPLLLLPAVEMAALESVTVAELTVLAMLHRTCDISVCCPSSLGLRKDGEGRVAAAVAYATKGTAERGFAVAGVEGGFCRARVHGLLLVVVAAFISRKRITSSRRNKGNDYLSEAILKLLGCNIDDPENLLVYEFVPRGNLDQVLFVIVGLGKVSIGSFSYGIRYGCPLP
ncbi:hypothetical protein JHK87_039638 [Glycine soja]|nr:hypothetical protein JHK87_039638 [Glycine soja]